MEAAAAAVAALVVVVAAIELAAQSSAPADVDSPPVGVESAPAAASEQRWPQGLGHLQKSQLGLEGEKAQSCQKTQQQWEQEKRTGERWMMIQ